VEDVLIIFFLPGFTLVFLVLFLQEKKQAGFRLSNEIDSLNEEFHCTVSHTGSSN
jgi:hypothetical protein